MKPRCAMGHVLFFFALLRSASGQNFTNLNFESAKIVSDPAYGPYIVYASDAIPGWTLGNNTGGNDIPYNTISLGAPSVALFSIPLLHEPVPDGSSPPLDGRFSIDLYGGVPGGGNSIVGVSISQTGLIPVGTESIFFIAQAGGIGDLLVSLGGQNIPFTAISTEPDYTLYGGDVSTFAGQVEPLTFTAPGGVGDYWELDDIQFSSSPVPEPGVLGLFGIGTLLCCRLRKKPWPASPQIGSEPPA